MDHLDSWVEPSRPPFISTLRLIELVDLLLKHVEDVARRAAVLELDSEWVCGKVLLGEDSRMWVMGQEKSDMPHQRASIA